MCETKDKTLCALKEGGLIDSHVEKFKKLIQPARLYCKNCGRCAVNSANLCNPEKL